MPLLLALPLLALLLAPSPPVARAQTLAERLYLNFLPINDAAGALTPPRILFAETPIVVRYTLIGGAAIYDARAACRPHALSFFATNDSVPPAFCQPDNNAILVSYATYRALLREFPAEMNGYADFLRTLGLEPVSSSRDPATLNGWANLAGDRLADFFQNDGWNSLGDRSRENSRIPFEDYTEYRPANSPYDPPFRLTRPLRWVPGQLNLGNGRLAHQIHVVPHLGLTVRPLILSDAHILARRVPAPYRQKNAPRITSRDRARVEQLVNEVLDASATLTPRQRFFARWWDNKLLSTGGISAFYETAGALDDFEVAQQFLGEMLSQHDALVIAWKEKRRHDLVRPFTLVRNLRRRQRFTAFVSEAAGFRTVRAEDWQSLISAQPHSEFPSGSAAICTAAMEHLDTYIRTKMGFVPSIKIRYPTDTLPFFVSEDTTVAFSGPLQAANNCAQSRLWAGVHFSPSLPAGQSIGRGVGKIVFEHMRLLGEGRIPANCTRCRADAAILGG
ncbi:hypothetical protein BWQ96_05767 [Gracilariopsis chorda]|uniref:Uncharacterized protein n=1 Tax=Gracilariopsis chorda TaxID=448386 RepID=A0A2V3IQV0_9FLOR|nr:hypothetical protein BWQ96_05767 [Gracilariopsis chorda]|eukprot:PXF44495.1 hypothetical protein BWQ96_05767 [Gracilariopsis chorda]